MSSSQTLDTGNMEPSLTLRQKQSPIVLVVEDCLEDRETIKRYLLAEQNDKYTIFEASEAEEGLELYQRCQPDVVLLDYQLPDSDGLEFLEQIQQEESENHSPIVLLTGQGNERVAVAAMKAGVCDYLIKGQVAPQELRSAVECAIGTGQLRAQLRQAQAERARQIEREKVVAQIANKIHARLDVKEILEATVSEVRHFLGCDRVFIYRFEPDWSGIVVAESVGDGWLPILHAQVEDTYFKETRGEDYRSGRIQVVADIERANLTQWHVDLLARFQVKANLAVPILPGESLWGLLVANQCSEPRHWQIQEIELLEQLTTQVGIALQQAELYDRLQSELRERQQTEQALRESEERFRQLAETIEDVFWMSNPQEHRLLYVSPAYETVWGRDLAGVYANYREWIEVIHPEDRDRVEKSVFESTREGKYDEEYRILRPDGSIRWVRDRGFPVRNESGAIKYVAGVAQDISDRKQADIDLHEANERFALAAAAVNGLIYDWDLKSDRVERTCALTKILGYTLEEASPTGQWWRERVHPEDWQKLNPSAFWETFTLEDRYCTEYRVLHKNGHYVWVEDRGIAVKDAAGNIVRVVGSTIDISDRKQVEISLKNSERRIASLAKLSPVGIFRGDPNGINCFYANERACEIAGLSPEKVLGNDWIDALHPDDRSKVLEQWQQTVKENIPFNLEYRFLHADGTIRWVIGQATAETDENDLVIGYIGTLTDISDRKQAEISLQESEARFRQIAETIEDVFWISIPWKRQILYLSPAYERIWGRTRESAYTNYQSWLESLHPDDREPSFTTFAEQIREGNFDTEYRIILSDGSIRWIHDRGFSIADESGNLQQVVGIAEDITDRKRAELALRESEKRLSERNQELDRFAYTVSHDLKAPLRAIANLSQWLFEDLQGQASEQNQRQIELLLQRVGRMEALIDGLLAYSRVGRAQVETQTVEVGQLLAEIIDSLAPPATFTIDIQPPIPTLIAKRLLLSQVFANLISNAIKHCDRADGQIEICATEKGQFYEFSVSDNGRGIPPEDRERIFGIFQTVQGRDRQENTGIGLSIVKKIIETEGGAIAVESELGKGATFRFTWPR